MRGTFSILRDFGASMFFNILRLVFTIIIGLIVFGWSFAAGDQQRNERLAHKTKLDLTPAFSRPDFGRSSQLTPSSLQLQTVRPLIAFSQRWDERIVLRASIRSLSLATISPNANTQTSGPERSPAPQALLRIVVERQPETQLANTARVPEPILKPSKSKKTESKTVALHPTSPNIKALAERIESHNYSVASIEHQLQEQEDWDLESVEAAAKQVEGIRSRQSLWSLYWELLDRKNRRRMQPFTLEKTIDELRQRIFEVMVRNQVEPDNVSSLTPDETKSRLESLDRKISGWK